MSVNEKILDAIELLAKNSVERAGYDKTIQAKILSCQDKELGKYKCKFQDATFYAYTNNSDLNLSNGSMVYVLVPENNMAKDKTILGTIDKLGVDYAPVAQGETAYQKIGTNIITTDSTTKFYLSSDEINYKREIQNLLTFEGLQQYLTKADTLIFAAEIETSDSMPTDFNYGIKIVINNQEFDFSNNLMVGNPYRLLVPIRQIGIFDDFKCTSPISLDKIIIYTKGNEVTGGEPNSTVLDTGDIILSHLELYGAKRLSQQQLKGYRLSILTPQGSFFKEADSSSSTLQLIAQIRKDNQVISSEGFAFHWGRADMNVDSDYQQTLGYGWKVQEETDSTYTVIKDDLKAKHNYFKVAAICGDGQEEILITRQIDIENKSGIDIQITSSDNQINFKNNIGNPTLTCTPGSGYLHRWAWRNDGGNFERAADVIGIAHENKLNEIQISKIINFADFACTIYDGSTYIGTGFITLTNEVDNEIINTITLLNGQTIFKYNETGQIVQNTQIKPLGFIFRDKKGHIIYDGRAEDNGTFSSIFTEPNYVRWYIPNKNTLLVDSNENPQGVEDNYNVYQNSGVISYQLAPSFNYNYVNNQIKLVVFYNGEYTQTQTRFTFTKQGDIGTNGTEYIVKIVLNTQMNNPPQYPMITNVNGIKNFINYGIANTDSETEFLGSQQLFKAELWRSGQRIWYQGGDPSIEDNTVPSIVWSIVKNNYGSSVEDSSDFTVQNSSTGTFTYSDSAKDNLSTAKANIIQCAITYNNNIYYGTIPVITAYVSDANYRINLTENTGFRYVIYNADGTNPVYNRSSPFDIKVTNNNEQVQIGSHYTFGVEGSIRGISNLTAQLIELDSNFYPSEYNQQWYKPINKYDGECINNAITCIYFNGGVTANIRIPVHLFLNRFGIGNINTWDGNSIKIDNAGGYILAPQMGAGEKDTNNRFTGVVMGKVREANKTNTQIGLFGYTGGVRSFFLNSYNGSAIFGRDSGGQIIIDPTDHGDGKYHAMLYSSDFWKVSNYDPQTGLPADYCQSQYNDAGMLIDLSTPQIVFKNKMLHLTSDGAIYAGRQKNASGVYTDEYNFSVDASGNVTLIGDLKAGKIDGTNNYNFEVNNSTKTLNFGYNNSDDDYNFKVNDDGTVTVKGNITAYSLNLGTGVTIAQSYIDGLPGRLTALDQGLAITVKQDGSIGSTKILLWETSTRYNSGDYVNYEGTVYKCINNHTSSSINQPPSSYYWEQGAPQNSFLVSSNGLLTANNAVIYGTLYSSAGRIGGTNGWTIGSTSQKGYIYSGNTNSFTSTYKGVYFGTDGIRINTSDGTKAFEFNYNTGTMYINGSNITLSKNTTVTWGSSTPTIENLIQNIVNGNSSSYITGTFIDGTTIKSPIIQGGQFYATGKGTNIDPPAYYISPGGYYDSQGVFHPNSPIGYIAYDEIQPFDSEKIYQIGDLVQYHNQVYCFKNSHHGDWVSSDAENGWTAAQRIIFNAEDDVVLKLKSGGDLSLTARSTYFSRPGCIFLEGSAFFNGSIRLTPVGPYTDSSEYGAYGTYEPGVGYAFSHGASIGQLYFKII